MGTRRNTIREAKRHQRNIRHAVKQIAKNKRQNDIVTVRKDVVKASKLLPIAAVAALLKAAKDDDFDMSDEVPLGEEMRSPRPSRGYQQYEDGSLHAHSSPRDTANSARASEAPSSYRGQKRPHAQRMTRDLDMLDTCSCVALCPRDERIAVGSTKGVLVILSAADGVIEDKFTAHQGTRKDAAGDGINAVAFLGTSRLVVGTYGGWIHIIKLKDTASGTSAPLNIPPALSPDDKRGSEAVLEEESIRTKAFAAASDTLKPEVSFQVPGIQATIHSLLATKDLSDVGAYSSAKLPGGGAASKSHLPEEFCLAIGGKSEAVHLFHIVAERVQDESTYTSLGARFRSRFRQNTFQARKNNRRSIAGWLMARKASNVGSFGGGGGGKKGHGTKFWETAQQAASQAQAPEDPMANVAACASVISMAAVEAHLDDGSGWDTVRLSRLLEVHLASPAVALAMDREGELLASVNEARIIHLWSIRRGVAALRTLTDEYKLMPEVEFRCATAVSSLSFSGDSKRLVVATLENTELYDIETDEELLDEIKATQRQSVESATKLKKYDLSTARSSRDNLIYSNPRDSHRRSVSNEDVHRSTRATITGRGHSNYAIGTHLQPAFSALPCTYLDRQVETGMAVAAREGHAIAIAGSHHISVYDAAVGSSVMQVHSQGRVRTVAISSDGTFVVVGTNNKQVLLFTIASGADMTILPPTRHGFSNYVPPSPAPVPVGKDDDVGAPSVSEVINRTWSMSVVRSVWVSNNESKLAMGSDNQGVGLVELYDIVKGKLDWCRVREDGAVWCVKISSDDKVLAAGGYCSCVTLYDATNGAELHKIECEARPDAQLGFAFVWTLAFSKDGKRFAYGSWAGVAQVFSFGVEASRSARAFLANPSGDASANGRDASADEEPVSVAVNLSEVASVTRSDRIYAIAISHDGGKLLCGGRDKKVALFQVDSLHKLGGGSGGSGGSGGGSGAEPKPLWELASTDYIYCVAATPDMEYCAYGGSNNTCTVVRGWTGERIFQVTSDAVVWSVALLATHDVHANSRHEGWHRGANEAIATSSAEMQSAESMVDADVLVAIGGEATGIRVIEIASRKEILHLPADETTFSVCLAPSVLAFTTGSRATVFGKGGDYYSWHEQPSFDIARSIFQRAVLSQHRLENVELLREVLQRHPTTVNQRDPETGTDLIQYACETTNHANMLQLLLDANCRKGLRQNDQMQTVISAALATNRHQALRTVFGALIKGQIVVAPGMDSIISNSFMRMAEIAPRELVNFVSKMPLQPEPEILADGVYDTVYLNNMLIIGNERRSPKGVWDETLENEMHLQHVASGQDKITAHVRKYADHLQRGNLGELVVDAVDDVLGGGGGAAGERSIIWRKNADPQQQSAGGISSSSSSQPVDSFSQASDAGGFANLQQGFRKSALGGATAYRVPFENIAGELSTNTGNLKVSMLGLIVSAAEAAGDMSVFGAKTMEILLHFKWNGVARRGFILTAVFGLSKAICFTLFNLFLTINDFDGLHAPLPWNEGATTEYTAWLIAQVVMIAIMSLWCINDLYDEWRQLNRAGVEDYFESYFNWLDLTRIFVQTAINILWFCRDVPDFGWTPLAHPELPCKDMPNCGSREALFGMQAAIFVVLWLYVLYFARADLDFAVLVHVLARVMVDILPFLQLVLALWLGFAFGLSLLFKVQVLTSMQLQVDDGQIMFHEQSEWNFATWMLHVLNMGLFGHFDDSTLILVSENWTIKILFLFYLLVMNLVLLNLLIAIMQYSYDKSTKEAQLVAKYRRAKLILEQQHSTRRNVQNPRWLHVLLPVEKDEHDLFAGSTASEIENIRGALDRLTERLKKTEVDH